MRILIITILILGFMYCSSSITLTSPELAFTNEPDWVLFADHVYTMDKIYLYTYCILDVTGTLTNTGTGTARDIYLLIDLKDKEKNLLHSEEVFIQHELQAGVTQDFAVKTEFEYCNEVMVKYIEFDLSYN